MSQSHYFKKDCVLVIIVISDEFVQIQCDTVIILYNVKPRLVNVPCIVQSFGRAIQDSVNVTPPPCIVKSFSGEKINISLFFICF